MIRGGSQLFWGFLVGVRLLCCCSLAEMWRLLGRFMFCTINPSAYAFSVASSFLLLIYIDTVLNWNITRPISR